MKCLKCGEKFSYKELLLSNSNKYTCDKCYTEYRISGSSRFLYIILGWIPLTISFFVGPIKSLGSIRYLTIIIYALIILLIYPFIVKYDVTKWGHD